MSVPRIGWLVMANTCVICNDVKSIVVRLGEYSEVGWNFVEGQVHRSMHNQLEITNNIIHADYGFYRHKHDLL